MKYSLFNFLSSTLIPELSADIAAGTTSHVHLALIGVAAVGTLPYQLPVLLDDLDFSVEAAHLTIIALGIQLRIHNMIVNELHYRQHRIQILLHLRHFHIADGSAGR